MDSTVVKIRAIIAKTLSVEMDKVVDEALLMDKGTIIEHGRPDVIMQHRLFQTSEAHSVT